MYLIGTLNTTTQTIETGEVVALGRTYRRYINKCRRSTALSSDFSSITILEPGIYHVTAKAIASGTEAGTLSMQLALDGVLVEGAIASDTIAATTDVTTLVIDHFILINERTILGCESLTSQSLTLVNTGVGATITNVVINVEKDI